MPYSLVLKPTKDYHFQWWVDCYHQSLQNNITEGIVMRPLTTIIRLLTTAFGVSEPAPSLVSKQ